MAPLQPNHHQQDFVEDKKIDLEEKEPMFSQYTTGIKTEEFLLLLRMKQYVTRSKISYCKFWHRRQILTFRMFVYYKLQRHFCENRAAMNHQFVPSTSSSLSRSERPE